MLALFIEMNGQEDKYLTENLSVRLWGYRSAGKKLGTRAGGLEFESDVVGCAHNPSTVHGHQVQPQALSQTEQSAITRGPRH